MEMQWYNFVTGEHEHREMPETDEEAVQYIPQIPAAISLFGMYRKMGKSIAEAMIEVLTSSVNANPAP